VPIEGSGMDGAKPVCITCIHIRPAPVQIPVCVHAVMHVRVSKGRVMRQYSSVLKWRHVLSTDLQTSLHHLPS